MLNKKTVTIIFTFLVLLFFTFCSPENEHPGEELAQKYCTSCHLMPKPELLNKEVWENHVLPKMGARLGMKMSPAEINYGRLLHTLGIAPAEEITAMGDWLLIQDYFISNAPEELLHLETQNLPSTNLFDYEPLDSLPPSLISCSFVDFDTISETYSIGDGLSFNYYQLKENKLDSFNVFGALSSVSDDGDMLVMGPMPPNDLEAGSIISLEGDTINSIIEGLRRPVHFIKSDLNNDGKEDYLVCSFGNILGDFSWYEAESGGGFRKHLLIEEPGAIRTYLADLNNDSLNDIVVLMAQGREGLFWFKNLGDGNFGNKETLIEFQPSYGSSYCELVDMNQDGKLDILYTNGDNGDYPPIMKPYHGIRIFMNSTEGEKVEFLEKTFLHFDGVYKAMASDFDLDGDIDIAALSYFPDYKSETFYGFRFYENRKGEFIPYTHEISKLGKWLVMEAEDIDKDGDQDILLGSSLMMTGDVPNELLNLWKENGHSVYILKNNTN